MKGSVIMFKPISMFLLFLILTFNYSNAAFAQVIHKTRSGDTLNKISSQYNTKIDTIANLNGLQKNHGLVLGQALLIPGSSYIVQQGDSLFEIANRHAIHTKSLMNYNK